MDSNVILHIEDNFHNCRLVRKILEFLGYSSSKPKTV
jgi:hypothetical protein